MDAAMLACSPSGSCIVGTRIMSTDLQQQRRSSTRSVRRPVVCEESPQPQQSGLASIIKNKERILESYLRVIADNELESHLALTKAVTKPYSLLDTIAKQIIEGRTAVRVLQVVRLSPADRDAGDARPALRPVLLLWQSVWMRRALRMVWRTWLRFVKVIFNRGFNVINMKDLHEVAILGVPIYGINISVRHVSISIPLIRQDIFKSLIGEVPFGASSLVGSYSVDEARTMKYAGADTVYIKHEVLATEKNHQAFLENLREAMLGDD